MSQFELNAVFSRKQPTFEPSNCIVEKVIQLTGAEYDRFRRNMLSDHDFIRDNIDLMYHEGDKLHCIMAVGEGRPDGVLIDSSGSSYARYAAFIPNAADILTAHQEREKPSVLGKIQEARLTPTPPKEQRTPKKETLGAER